MLKWQALALELVIALVLVITINTPTSAAMRLQERSLYINSSVPGETTFYKLSFRYMSPEPVGSVELLFCVDPIPYHPCVVPVGMDVSGAVLTEQLGEAGFTVTQQTANRMVLSRTSSLPVDLKSSYTFDNIVNPTASEQAFSIRLRTLASSDATGPLIDFGSVRAQVAPGIEIQTQVPPMLIFCLAEEVAYNCEGTNEVYSKDMGELRTDSTLTAQSQMAVGTNASAGFVVTAHAAPMSAGTRTLRSLSDPTPSMPGQSQFGINLVENTEPVVGVDPEGEWTNAVVSPDYGQPNMYKFVSGDTVAYSPNVSLMKKFTVSYIVNASPSVHVGTYITTVNFIASGRF